MPSSPTINNEGLVNVSVKIAGSAIDASIMVAGVTVEYEVNRIPSAKLRLLDGDIASKKFTVTEQSNIAPGSDIEILAGYGTSSTSIFKGIITGLQLSLEKGGRTILELDCRDKAIKMTGTRKSAYYLAKKDSDVLQQLASDAGLSPSVDSTSVSHKQLLQYYCSDWDFLLLRAEINGFIVLANGGELTVGKPKVSASSALSISLDDSIEEMNLQVDAINQFSSVKVVYWDPSQQKIQTTDSTSPSVNEQGDLSSSTLASAVNSGSFLLQTGGLINTDDSDTWATAQLQKSWLSRIKGEIKFAGNASVKAGDIITLDGLSTRFNGSGFVSSVVHEIEDGEWFTTTGLGLDYNWFSEKRDIEAAPAGGLLSAIQGLQVGVVTKIDGDPDNEFRVKVKLPLMQDDGEGIWVRLSTFYATNNAGNFFYPETDDEVIIGFMNNDPRHGVILGSVYSSKNAAPLTPDEKNSQKAIITKANLKLLLDDENKIITITTPANNKIVISDKDKSIEITDQNSNSIKMDSDGITMSACKNVTIKAQQDISLTATGNIKLNATQDVKVSGMNIEESAQVKYSAAGQAQAEFTASGQLTVKGAMVMIN
jgi:Rhs element Vgr protein